MEKSLHKRFHVVEENYKRINCEIAESAIRAGKKPEDIILLAVTKTVEPELVNHAVSLGVSHIGENKVQEFLSKEKTLALDKCKVHLIGHLQTNKVRQIIGKVEMIQSVDSIRIANEINLRSKQMGIKTDVLIEVNIGREENKFGVDPDQILEFLDQIREFDSISIKGLMTIPPICDKIEKNRLFFYNMNKLFVDISEKKSDNSNIDMKYLSMGMSSDFKEAILEGANIVRIGTDLFGSRI